MGLNVLLGKTNSIIFESLQIQDIIASSGKVNKCHFLFWLICDFIFEANCQRRSSRKPQEAFVGRTTHRSKRLQDSTQERPRLK